VCRACGEALGYRTSATDLLNLDVQVALCLHCFYWTDSYLKPSGTGTVPRQQEGRRKTDG